MANPEDEKTVINVIGVSAKARERANQERGKKQDETMHDWVSQAANHLDDRGSGRGFSPTLQANLRSEMVKPSGLTAPELAGLMQRMAALATATGTSPTKADVRRAYALVDHHGREARGGCHGRSACILVKPCSKFWPWKVKP